VPHAPDIRVRTLLRLGRHEVYRGQCFHAGLLFEGHSGDGHGGDGRDGGGRVGHRLDVHRAGDASVLATARLVHTAEFIHPFGPGAVIVVGKHYLPRAGWRTYHSVARLVRGRLRVRTRTMPSGLQVEQFGGSPRAMFFNEPGSRQVYRWTCIGPRALGPEIHLPGTMIVAGNGLYVLERNHVVPGRENLARIDLATRSITRTFPTPRRRLCALLDLPGTPWLAVAETWAEQVLIVEKATNRLARVLPVPGGPVALARLGRGLAVFCDEPRRIDFLDPTDGAAGPLARWNLTDVGAELANVTAFDIDPESGDVYLRSPFHPRVEGGEPAVTLIADASGRTRARCGTVRDGGPHAIAGA